MSGFTDRVARRPWSVPGLMVSLPLSAYLGWAVVAIFSDPDTYEYPWPMLGIPVQWVTLGAFLVVSGCAAMAAYRLVFD